MPAGGGGATGAGARTGTTTTTTTLHDVRVEEAEEDFNGRGRGRRHGSGKQRGAGAGGSTNANAAMEKVFPGGVNPGYTPAGAVAAFGAAAAASLRERRGERERRRTGDGVEGMNLPVSRWACDPVDCQERWGNWSECDSPCFRGAEQRRWVVTLRGTCGGAPCTRVDGRAVHSRVSDWLHEP
jgi:hypothetical protein